MHTHSLYERPYVAWSPHSNSLFLTTVYTQPHSLLHSPIGIMLITVTTTILGEGCLTISGERPIIFYDIEGSYEMAQAALHWGHVTIVGPYHDDNDGIMEVLL